MSNCPNDNFVKKNVDKLKDFVSKWNKTETPITEPKSRDDYEYLNQLNKLNAQKIDLLNEKLELINQIVQSHEKMIEAQTRMIDVQTKYLLEIQSHKRLIEELQHLSEDFETRISNLENSME